MSEPQLTVIQETGVRCRNLLSKGMFINAGLPKGKEIAGDGNFWCGKTQTVFGPDKGLCDGDQCTDAAHRTCYEA